jgi:hypothetical protein
MLKPVIFFIANSPSFGRSLLSLSIID